MANLRGSIPYSILEASVSPRSFPETDPVLKSRCASMRHRVFTVVPFLFAAVFLTGCGEGGATAPPSMVILLIDTLRADHVTGYGGEETLTPEFAKLAHEGVVFRNVLAASPWTGPSVAALLTGRYPDELGVRHLTDPFPQGAVSLAERFRAAGFATGAVVSNGVVGPAYGYDRGFDHFRFERNRVHRDASGRVLDPPVLFGAAEVTDAALEWIRDQDGPFFLYVHYNDPHDPYLPPAAWREKGLEGRKPLAEGLLLDGRFAAAGLGAAEAERLRGHYRGEVAFTDHEAGRLIEALDENTVVVVVGDHGEEFREHGRFRHGHSLYQELLRVPLIMKGPGIARGVTEKTPVSHVDLAPTLFELAGLEGSAPFAGRSLAGLIASDRAGSSREAPGISKGKSIAKETPKKRAEIPSRPENGTAHSSSPGGARRSATGPFADRMLFSLLESRRSRRIAVVRGDLKLIYRPARDRYRLFDLAADPGETRDLSRALPRQAEALLEAARERARRLPSPLREEGGGMTDPGRAAREAELRALGYVK